ncbi:MAG: hypothetical protein NVS9B14_02280 [Candidatus Acidiferrum sp.]
MIVNYAVGPRVRISLCEKFCPTKRAALLHKPMNKKTVLPLEKYNIAATNIVDPGTANQRNISWANPRLHAGAANQQMNAPMVTQLSCDSGSVVFAPLTCNLARVAEWLNVELGLRRQAKRYSAN